MEECPICLSPPLIPLALACSHALCYFCYARLPRPARCPQCRQAIGRVDLAADASRPATEFWAGVRERVAEANAVVKADVDELGSDSDSDSPFVTINGYPRLRHRRDLNSEDDSSDSDSEEVYRVNNENDLPKSEIHVPIDELLWVFFLILFPVSVVLLFKYI